MKDEFTDEITSQIMPHVSHILLSTLHVISKPRFGD